MFATSSFARTVVGTVGAALFAATCLAAAVAPAGAAEVRSQVVQFKDLDLNNAKGRAALDARIRSAARNVCQTGSNDLTSRMNEVRCTNSAIAKAIHA